MSGDESTRPLQQWAASPALHGAWYTVASQHKSSQEKCKHQDDQGAGALGVTGSLRRTSGSEAALESRKPYATTDHASAGNADILARPEYPSQSSASTRHIQQTGGTLPEMLKQRTGTRLPG